MGCDCTTFPDIELLREAISARIRASERLRRQLVRVDSRNPSEHALYLCPDCGQQWQFSRAWNWGNRLYGFRVPAIELNDWLEMHYVQPDEMLLYSALMHDFFTTQPWEDSSEGCRKTDCSRPAVRGQVLCKEHHIRSLQNASMLPKEPTGRWFSPYGWL